MMTYRGCLQIGSFGIFKNPKSKNQILRKGFLSKVLRRDWYPSDTRSRYTLLLMHAISDVEEKYGSHAMYRWFYQEHTFFANFHFPVTVADRYASSSVGRNYLFGHVSRIIYYRNQPTSAVNRGNTKFPKIKTRNSICNIPTENEMSLFMKSSRRNFQTFHYFQY